MKKLFPALFTTGHIVGLQPANTKRYNKPILRVVHEMTMAIEACRTNRELNKVVKQVQKQFTGRFHNHVSYAHYLSELTGRIQGKRYELNINSLFS
jgi:hypothetical protein